MVSVVLTVALLLVCAGDHQLFQRSEPAPVTVELDKGWLLAASGRVPDGGPEISSPGYQAAAPAWHRVTRMPATVLDGLQQDGTYSDLYSGTNLRDAVPQDLYLQDWWYRTAFTAPVGHSSYRLDFPGINYRAEVWLNGELIADSSQVVGMYVAHELDVTDRVRTYGPNVLAVKVIPERSMQNVDGVELADSWYDWINSQYLGRPGNSFVPDRNAGIFKPVYLNATGAVDIGAATVNTDLRLPEADPARLTVYANVHNNSVRRVRGMLRATISRAGKPDVRVGQPVVLGPGERREITFDPNRFGDLVFDRPDLWWPYTLGDPALYELKLDFYQRGRVIDSSSERFGIRTFTQHRDGQERFPGSGGNFYLAVNGRDLLVRGAVYTPDLLFRPDPDREDAILGYVRDLGLNMLRLEAKIPGERLIERADELGIPLMVGWMCCNQWEKWEQWDDEDRAVAQASLRSQAQMLRAHPSVAVWANASDGIPPEPLRGQYHAILRDLHWQNAVVDTVSALAREDWDGIHMAGPYTWRPPSYWFSGRYPATRGATAEQGDNEHIPPYASLTKFIPPDALWPIDDTWFFHAGSDHRNAVLTSVQRVVNRRYGPSSGAEEFAGKAQLAHYESTRAQFEAFAAQGWADHKMTIHWMLNSHWPSFFGHIFDYYLRPGGAYYGAKAGLRPLSVVFDSYATGDHGQAHISVVNQTPADVTGLRARVRIYDLQGRVRDDRTAAAVDVRSGDARTVLTLPRAARDSPVFFVRCELIDAPGAVIAQNVYWQSQRRDDVGTAANDGAFETRQISWADMTALNRMAKVPLEISAERTGERGVTIRLRNATSRLAFFERAELLATRDGDEILPIQYSDNYVTVFPGETLEVRGSTPAGGPRADWVRVSGHNTVAQVVAIR
ncbi:MAG: glycoside hydrolase [Mycobacterium sp.]